jgi:hypothetical protein
VLTSPDPNTGTAVCVNITDRKNHPDDTVILKPGDHPFITKESVVYYVDAQFLNVVVIDRVLSTNAPVSFVFGKKESCSSSLLEKIQKGLITSRHTRQGIKDYCKKAWSK